MVFWFEIAISRYKLYGHGHRSLQVQPRYLWSLPLPTPTMSSTYVHYSTPSSLPSDYAVLSRYAHAREQNNLTIPDDIDDYGSIASNDNNEDELGATSSRNGVPIRPDSLARRSSFPTAYIRPLNPRHTTLPANMNNTRPWTGSKAIIPSENTPLLGPLVPRIHEDVDSESDRDEGSTVSGLPHHPSGHSYWEECMILLKYTMPVFG